MLSRVADTIYWLARYMERTSGMLQVLRTNYISSQDEGRMISWAPLLQNYSLLEPDEIAAIEYDSRKVLEYLVVDKTNATSAYNYITQSRENARSIQDHITKEVWQCLNDYYHFVRKPETEHEIKTGDPVSAIDLLLKNNVVYTGIVENTMTRDEAFTYMNIGKLLERSIQTTDILRMKMQELSEHVHFSIEAPGLRYLLYSLFGFEIYLKTYKGKFNADNVLQLIVYNADFPHSILYCLDRIHRSHAKLKAESLSESYENLEFVIGKTRNNLKYSNIQAGNSEDLNRFLTDTRKELFEIAGAFSKHYFGIS